MKTVLVLLIAAWAAIAVNSAEQQSRETDALLKIAREYRDGKDGAHRSALRAARFYELLMERSDALDSTDINMLENRREAEFELSELLETDPTLSKRYSYLSLLIQSASGGHPEAQHKLSVSYATGIAARDLTPMDAGRSLFLEYMSALSGNVMANLGMAYRYQHGVGVTESCEAALPHYQFAADHAAEAIQRHGIHANPPDTMKLSEANDPSSRHSRRDGTHELADYYAHLAEQGDTLAAVTLGNMLLSGTRHMALNETLALHYLNLAAEAQNPAGAGLQGYVLLNQYLRDVEDLKVADGLIKAQQYAQSSVGMHRADKFLKLMQFANRKGDVHGTVGLGVAHFHGVGVRANLTRALELLERTAGAHPDSGFYIGEICMGRQSMELSGGGGTTNKGRFQRHEVTTDGIVKGRNSAEVKVLESHAVNHAIQQKEIDPAAATRAYTVSAQQGHILAQHRLAHLYKRGLGGAVSCKETVKLFKAVAERGPWMTSLAVAHKLYAEGNEMAALHLFAQLAAVGVESAQYNAAYILSKCTRCPPMNKVAALGIAGAVDSTHASDPLEKQHRSLKHSTATDFRALLKMHEAHEAQLRSDADTKKADGAALDVKQGGVARPASSSVDPSLGGARSIPYLPSAAWREYLAQHHPDSLVGALDLEFAQAPAPAAEAAQKEALEAARMRGCEARALTLFDLSAQQGNSEAYMQLGDFYYYQRAGLLQEERKREAAEFYQKAADLHHTQAIFNLGIMHEVGDGVSQDFHLAKRYYDQAAEVDTKARVPRDIALLVLEGHKTFNAVFGPHAASQIMSTNIHLPVSWGEFKFRAYTLWELAEYAAALDRRVRRSIDAAVLWYCEHVLQPSRDVMEVMSAPLRVPVHLADSTRSVGGAARRAAGEARSPAQPMEHSLRGYWKVFTALPELVRAYYDRVFEVAFMLLQYLLHPELTGQRVDQSEAMQLREELLLVLLLVVIFCMVLVFKVLRRQLRAALQADQQLLGQLHQQQQQGR